VFIHFRPGNSVFYPTLPVPSSLAWKRFEGRVLQYVHRYHQLDLPPAMGRPPALTEQDMRMETVYVGDTLLLYSLAARRSSGHQQSFRLAHLVLMKVLQPMAADSDGEQLSNAKVALRTEWLHFFQVLLSHFMRTHPGMRPIVDMIFDMIARGRL